jgi:cytochrome c553
MKNLIILGAIVGVSAALSASAADAKGDWTTLCAKCHGADGQGHTRIGEKLGVKDFTDAKVQSGFTDEAAFKAIKDGLKRDDRTLMKSFSDLSDDQIKGLVQYVRGLKK